MASQHEELRDDLIELDVLDLLAGDVVHLVNGEWPQPFSAEPIYIYTVDSITRHNEDLVTVMAGETRTKIHYEPGDRVLVQPDRPNA